MVLPVTSWSWKVPTVVPAEKLSRSSPAVPVKVPAPVPGTMDQAKAWPGWTGATLACIQVSPGCTEGGRTSCRFEAVEASTVMVRLSEVCPPALVAVTV